MVSLTHWLRSHNRKQTLNAAAAVGGLGAITHATGNRGSDKWTKDTGSNPKHYPPPAKCPLRGNRGPRAVKRSRGGGRANASPKNQSLKIRAGRPKKRHSPQFTYQISHTAIISTLAGLQNVGDIVAVMTGPQINTSTGAAYNFQQAFTSLYDQIPDAKNIGGTLYATRILPNQKLHVDKVSVMLDLANMEDITCTVFIHVHKCVKDTNSTPAAVMNVSVGTTNQGGAISSISGQGPGLTVGVAGAPTIFTPYENFAHAKNIRQYFKHVSTVKCILSPGATEHIQINIPTAKVVKFEEITTGSGLAYVKGYSYHVSVETKGGCIPLAASTIWITSNLDPRMWYADLDSDTRDALIRRLNITHYN